MGLALDAKARPRAIAEIRAAWLDNLIAVFPNADMTPEQHIAFSKRFYDLAYTPGLLPRFMGRTLKKTEQGFEDLNRALKARAEAAGPVTAEPVAAN